MITHVQKVSVYGGSVSEYTGLSTDTKPVYSTAGSYFYESDTCALYIFDQNAWVLVERHSPVHNEVINPDTLEWESQVQGTAVGGEEEVAITNWPATQPVSIASSVGVTGTFWPDTQPVSGSVSVGNFPETQPVSGSVSVSNFPATQPVSASALPLPSGAATSASQATLESLIDTLQELCQRLAPLGGSVSMVGGQALRVNTGGSTFAVSGPILATDYHIAGRNWPLAMALHNMTAQINIDNVTAA